MQKDSTFAVFGKVMAVLVVLAALVAGGFILGQKGTFKAGPTLTPTPEDALTTPAPIQTPILAPSGQAGGGNTQSTAQILTAGSQQFGFYAMGYLSDWTPQHEAGGGIDRLTLTKGGYQIAITQGAGGAGSCVYEGDQNTPPPQSQQFKTHVDFQGRSAIYRRSAHDDGATEFTICQQNQSGFAYPTAFGYINYTTPLDPDPQVLALMDQMIATLAPQQAQQTQQQPQQGQQPQQ